MLLSFSSINSVSAQQRPSQRSFANVLAKIKEKQSGRNKMIEQMQSPPGKEGTLTPGTTSPKSEVKISADNQGKGTAPEAALPPSRKKMQVPVKPKH